MIKKYHTFILLMFLSGCTTQPVKQDILDNARKSLGNIVLPLSVKNLKLNEVKNNPSLTIEHDKADDNLNLAFKEMLLACQGALNGFEQTSTTLKYTQVAMGVIGSLVGGIAIPALSLHAASNAVIIAALGGLSGTTNALQGSMTQEGLTARDMLQTRQKVLDDWKSAISDYYNPQSTPELRLIAINKGLVACTLYSITLPTNE